MKTRIVPGPFMTDAMVGKRPYDRYVKHFGYKHPRMTLRQVRDMVRRYFRQLPQREAQTYAPVLELGEHIAGLNRIDIAGYARGLNFPILQQIWKYLERSSFLIRSTDPQSAYVFQYVKLRKGMKP